jgi:PAS domain S-box-containing protein
MGSAYELLSREELLALLTSESARARRDAGEPPASGDRYRQIVEEASDGIFISDSSGRYLDVNEVGARMLGMTREEVIGKSITEVLLDSEKETFAQARARIGAGEWVLHEWQLRRKDGSIFTGEVSSKLLPDGRFQGICRDVTARREREEALRLSELRFRALTAATFEGIAASEHGVIVDVNEQLTRLIGCDRSDLIGHDVAQFIAPESREAVASAIRSGRETPYRHSMLRKDGTRLEVETQARSTDWMGRPVRITAIRDVGAQLQLEERLNRVQRLEALGRLAGGIAHDFNNILVAIFSYADLTDLDAEEPVQVRAHMEGLRAAARRARDLVQQILTFSRQRGDERARTNMQPIVDEALRFLRSSLPSSIEVRSELDPNAPAVLGAPVQLHQVIMNLCVNAAHAMQKSGVLSVRLSRSTVTPELSGRIPELTPTRDYLRLVVQDTGSGMDSATLGRIFEPFFTTKEGGEGSGLGLAVVHGIVKSHEGAISVESALGHGTTFEVYLPAVE